MASVLGKLSEYELKRLARMQRNQAFLDKLELKEASEEISGATERKQRQKRSLTLALQRRKKRKMNLVSSPSPSRRSNRQAKQPVKYDPAALDTLLALRPIKPRVKKSPAQRNLEINLNDEQRSHLNSAEEFWLEDFEHFLLRIPHGRNNKVISEANARTVMRQTRVLVSGSGVPYRHWAKGTIFAPNRPVTLRTNLVALYDEAKAFERKHGEDKGHGWLMLHPIMKLLCFQLYRYGKIQQASSNGANEAEMNLKEEEETVIEAKKKGKETAVGMLSNGVRAGNSSAVRLAAPVQFTPKRCRGQKRRRGLKIEKKKTEVSVQARNSNDEVLKGAPVRKSRRNLAKASIKIGTSICKRFGKVFYSGEIASVDTDTHTGGVLYHVVYEDGDEEDMSLKEVVKYRKSRVRASGRKKV